MTNLRSEIRACLRALSGVGMEHVTGDLVFPDGFTAFKGHFPGDPILPGVCVIDAVLVLLEDAFKQALTLRKVVSAKFHSPIRPGVTVRIHCKDLSRDGSVLRGKALAEVEGKKAATLLLEFTCDEA